jgi:molecular chaperone GrpE
MQEQDPIPPSQPAPEEASSQEQTSPSSEQELKECRDKYLRLLAEMENTRKRMQKEKHETTRFAIENMIADFLIPMDNLENALGFAQKMSEETRNWAMGFQMILGQFKEVLSNNGIAPFTSVGTLFDPHKHEAVETEETTEMPEGTIIQEFIRGYKCGDRIIRPARVKVAKKPGAPKEAQENDKKNAQQNN